MTAVLQSLRVCGNILSTENFSVLVFRCAACDLDFEALPLFVKHLHDYHSTTKNQKKGFRFRDVSTIAAAALEDAKCEELQEEEVICPAEYLKQMLEVVDVVDDKDAVDLLRSDCEEFASDDDVDKEWKPAPVESVEVKSELKLEEGDADAISDFEWADDNEDDDDSWKKTKKNKDKSMGESPHKKLPSFYFDLARPEFKENSLEFLRLLEARPCLWNTTSKSRYRTKPERIAARNEIILHFREMGYATYDKTIARYICNILREYKDAEQQAAEISSKPDELDERAKLILETYKFLSGRGGAAPELNKEKKFKQKLRTRRAVSKTSSDDSAEEPSENEEDKNVKRKIPKRRTRNFEESFEDDGKLKSEDPGESNADKNNSADDSMANEYSDDDSDGSKSATGPEVVDAKTKLKMNHFYFDLAKSEHKEISLKFLQLLEARPCLWNTTKKSRYGKKPEREKAREEILLQLREMGYKTYDKTIGRYVRNILREYKAAEQKAAQKGNKLDERSKLVLKNYKFLSSHAVEADSKEKKFKQKLRKRQSKTCSDDSAEEGSANEEEKKFKRKKPKRRSEQCFDNDGKIKSEDFGESQADNSDDDSVANEDSDDSDGSGSLKSATGPEVVDCKTTSKRKHLQLPYKRIRFQLLGNKIASDFIDLLREQPVVWDYTHPHYRKRAERMLIIETWIPHFEQQHNVTFTYHDLNENWINLRRYFARRQVVDPKRLSRGSLALRDRLSFLSVRTQKMRIRCEHCDSYVMGKPSYLNHLYLKHGIGECQFKCETCGGREFRGASELKLHMKQSHPAGEPEFSCDFCDRKFPQRGNMLRHQQLHTGIIMNFVCPTCGQSFRRKANLEAHEVRIHLRQRNFACSMCPKAFYTKGLLQDHINTHLNIRRHKCPTCEKGFHSSHALMRHKQIHTEVKKYACKLCDARFHQFVGLNAHMKHRHQYVNKQDAEIELEAVVPVVHYRYRTD